MADETEHARLCFGIASRYRGEGVGPGPLAIEGSLEQTSLEDIVITAIREGCVGETIAAIEASEAAEHATDPAIAGALRRISADETRHAELAWRFVQWALERGGAELEASVRAEFDRQARGAGAGDTALSPGDRALLRNGVVPPALRETLRSQALMQVVAPCARALGRPCRPDGRDSSAPRERPLP
jgi:hypothetical protein